MRRSSAVVVLLACGAPAVEPAAPQVSEMTSPRAYHAMTVLPSGQVLVAGGSTASSMYRGKSPTTSAELYDPATGSWTPTGTMSVDRSAPDAVLLPSGKVLLAGGVQAHAGAPCGFFSASAELYDPDTGTFSATGSMQTPRTGGQTVATVLLATGDVLAFGGYDDPDLSHAPNTVSAQAEIYHAETGTWTRTGDMMTARGANAMAVRLASGDVLVVGGDTRMSACTFNGGIADAEIYSPATGTWSRTQALDYAVTNATMTLLPSGEVLLVGGSVGANDSNGNNFRARIYDPGSRTWRATGSTNLAREWAAAVRLPSGKVLVVGGTDQGRQPELGRYGDLFDPIAETWSTARLLAHNHGIDAQSALLPDGDVLITGGIVDSGSWAPLIGVPDPYVTPDLWHITDIAERFHAPD